ncbi:polyketide synthase dehydratase domain-containing protein [Streptomyces stramineus]
MDPARPGTARLRRPRRLRPAPVAARRRRRDRGRRRLRAAHRGRPVLRPGVPGLTHVWRRDDEIFAEVRLPEPAQADAAAFGLHPALLDAALHAALPDPAGTTPEPAARLAAQWDGLRLYATGASVLRVRLTPAADGTLSVRLADGSGQPVASVDSLALRPVSAGELGDVRTRPQDSLFHVGWNPLPVPRPESGTRWALLGSGEDVAGERFPTVAAVGDAVAAGTPSTPSCCGPNPRTRGTSPPRCTPAPTTCSRSCRSGWRRSGWRPFRWSWPPAVVWPPWTART